MFYTIVAPGTIRPNLNYHVSISTHNVEVPCLMKIGIKGTSFNDEKQIEIPPNSEKSIDFQIPLELKSGDYNLTAMGFSGLKFKNETCLTYNKKYRSIFIQTDKATYKPGDLVRFRVLILDSNTRPVKLVDSVDILFIDSDDNHIKQFKNIKLTNGVFVGELQLSQFPVLGVWIIEVSVGEEKETKSFEIAKYTLPKFEMDFEVPKHILVGEKIRATVRAKYTYGKPIKGNVLIEAKEYNYWSVDNAKILTITAPLDGKAYFEIDPSELGMKKRYSQEISLTATVEEKLTGKKIDASARTLLHNDKYKIEAIDIPHAYVPNEPFKVTVVVKNYDGTPVQNSEKPVKFILSPSNHRWYIPMPVPLSSDDKNMPASTVEPQSKEKPSEQIIEQNIDENGMATVEFTILETEDGKRYSIQAKYLDTELYVSDVSKKKKDLESSNEDFELKIITKKPKLNKDVEIKIQSKDPLKYFVYQILGRGTILKSGRVNVPEEVNEYILKIEPTFEMVPHSTVYIYFVKDNKIKYKSIDLKVENQLQNSIKIDTPDKAKPGEEIDISITTDPGSYVGLLGVDQSVLLLKSGNDLSKEKIIGEMASYRTTKPFNFGFEKRPTDSVGLVLLTNVHIPVIQHKWYKPRQNEILFGAPMMRPVAPLPGAFPNALKASTASTALRPLTSVRKIFSEVWIFESINCLINDSGELKINKRVPDTITSWILTGFSVNPKTGLGLTEKPRKFEVFQPFFVSTHLPYSVKRGEIINIPIAVFNYMDRNLNVDVTLDNSNKEFEFAEVSNGVNEVLSEDDKHTKSVNVKLNSGESLSFLIRPKCAGHITLKISAVSPLAGDAIEQILLVEPEGVTQYKNKAVYIDLIKQSESKQEVSIDIPKNIVPDSVYSEISFASDLLGPVIKNLGSLVRVPNGCGEQIMVNFVPNILVLKYLIGLKKLTSTIEEKVKKHLEIGYQRELSYKHSDGSYSAFGKNDRSGSTWLTAYVARSFREAADYILIDEKVIKQALEFLAKIQVENGSFPEVGRVIDYSQVEGDKTIFLTAFTLTAFLENQKAFPEYHDAIKKGINYLIENVDSDTKVYSLSLVAYVLAVVGHEQKQEMLEKLKSRRIGDNVAWEENPKPSDEKKGKNFWYWDEPPTNNIESTSYAMLAMLENGCSGDDIVPVLKWLVSKRNSLGGYYSTQATVVGLQAFIKFSEKFGSIEKNYIDICFTDDKGTNGKITINNDNSLLLQTHVLPPEARHINFVTHGKGSILAQVSYRYNVANVTEEPRFKLETKLKNTKSPDNLLIDIYTRFVPTETEKQSNMVVMEVSLPTGYISDKDNLKALESVDGIKKVETKKGDTVIVVYFDSLDSNEMCISIEALRTHKIRKQKPASIIIYDYYDNTRQARIFYDPPVTSLGDISESDDCGND